MTAQPLDLPEDVMVDIDGFLAGLPLTFVKIHNYLTICLLIILLMHIYHDNKDKFRL